MPDTPVNDSDVVAPEKVTAPVQPDDSEVIDVAPAADQGGLPNPGLVSMETETLLLGVICFASVVTMIAASRLCDTYNSCEKEMAWAVCVGLISLVACLVMLIMSMKCKPTHDTIQGGFGVVLFIWWLFGVGAGTFKAPFKATQNGYFAEWLGFFCALYYMVLTCPRIKNYFFAAQERANSGSGEQKYAGLILIFSIIVVLAACVECTDVGNCGSEYGWALACSVVSAVITMVYIPCHTRFEACNAGKYIGYFLVVWWMAGAGVFTFDRPFIITGNGYFASWSAMIASIFFAMEAGKHQMPSVPALPTQTGESSGSNPASDLPPAEDQTQVTAEAGTPNESDGASSTPSDQSQGANDAAQPGGGDGQKAEEASA